MSHRDLSTTDFAGLELEASREASRRRWAGLQSGAGDIRVRHLRAGAWAPDSGYQAPTFPKPAPQSFPRWVVVSCWVLAITAPGCIALGLWLGSK